MQDTFVEQPFSYRNVLYKGLNMAHRCLRYTLCCVSFLLLLCLPYALQASPDAQPVSLVKLSELPPEARHTLSLIKQGGPFPYPRDGTVFNNYERRLPPHARGYYHEYTVKTPGVRSRGARRIVCGPRLECYYSGDHYRTFQRIQE